MLSKSDFLNDYVYTASAHVYCQCGDAARFTGSWSSVEERVEEFWGYHNGEGHGPADALRCRIARKRRSNNSLERTGLLGGKPSTQ